MIKSSILILILFTITGCSIGKIKDYFDKYSVLTISSSPEKAKVYIYTTSSKKYILIGETPLEINNEELKKKTSSQNIPVSLIIQKEGYIKENVLHIQETSKNVSIDVSLKKAYEWTDPNNFNTSAVINETWINLQDINKDIRKLNYKSAISQIKILINRFPHAPVLRDIKGSILYLMNKRQEAQKEYNIAKKLREKIKL